jgi:hypothetical protein
MKKLQVKIRLTVRLGVRISGPAKPDFATPFAGFTWMVMEGRRLPAAPAASGIREATIAPACFCSQDSQASFSGKKNDLKGFLRQS